MLSTCFSVASIGRQSLARARAVPDEAPPSTWWHHLRSLVGWNRPAVGRLCLSSREQDRSPAASFPTSSPSRPTCHWYGPGSFPRILGGQHPQGAPSPSLSLGFKDGQILNPTHAVSSVHHHIMKSGLNPGRGMGRRKTGVS